MWKSLTNVGEIPTNKKELISNDEIKNTPFTITGNTEKGYFLAIGRYRITEATKTKEETLDKLENEPWLIVSRIAAAYIDFNDKLQTNELLTPVDNELLNKQ